MEIFEIVEKGEFKRTYKIKAENADEALEKMYSGDFEPDFEVEDNNEVTVYDEEGNVEEV